MERKEKKKDEKGKNHQETNKEADKVISLF